MPINNINPFDTKFRVSGIATGMDTEMMVKQLMRVERLPIDKLGQKKQLAEWRRDEYRKITNLIRGIKDEFFNSVKPATNMLSQSFYSKFAGTSSDSSVVTVSGNSEAVAGTHTVIVRNLATAGRNVGAEGVTKPLQGSDITLDDLPELSGQKIRVTLDGVSKDITLEDLDADGSDLKDKLQSAVDSAFGGGKISVQINSTKLTFSTQSGASRITLQEVPGGDALSKLGFTSGASNRLNLNQSLELQAQNFLPPLTFGGDNEDKLIFTINGKEFTFGKTDTLAGMMSRINSDATAKVSMQYDEIKDQFIITSKELGSGSNIVIDQNNQIGNFFGLGGAAKVSFVANTAHEGKDAAVEINGTVIKRSSNVFTVNGVTYTLLKESPVKEGTEDRIAQTVSLSQDIDSMFNNIKTFVDKYNEMLSAINVKVLEKYERSYQPLTPEQKEGMKEDEIKKWEEKAKSGLLRSDSLLQNIVFNMRKALSEPVIGASTTLAGIGIKTGTWEQRGKLVIDENRLKAALQSNPDAVKDLFTKESNVRWNANLNNDQRKERFANQGLAFRISDVIEDNIRTFRDSNNKKGFLLEKAGIEKDASEFSNSIFSEIRGYNNSIDAMTRRLIQKENNYYKKFAEMEKAISKMNSQSSWLSAQLSQMG